MKEEDTATSAEVQQTKVDLLAEVSELERLAVEMVSFAPSYIEVWNQFSDFIKIVVISSLDDRHAV